jgi:hypothetical protein
MYDSDVVLFDNNIIIRGSERIRTAVNGFADHCLATRPRNRII